MTVRSAHERNIGSPELTPSMANDDDRPATKRDLDRLGSELRGEMGSLRAEMTSDMGHLEERLIEKMRDMQTEILRAFHPWARPVEVRLRSLDERMGLLEERVGAIERGEKAQ